MNVSTSNQSWLEKWKLGRQRDENYIIWQKTDLKCTLTFYFGPCPDRRGEEFMSCTRAHHQGGVKMFLHDFSRTHMLSFFAYSRREIFFNRRYLFETVIVEKTKYMFSENYCGVWLKAPFSLTRLCSALAKDMLEHQEYISNVYERKRICEVNLLQYDVSLIGKQWKTMENRGKQSPSRRFLGSSISDRKQKHSFWQYLYSYWVKLFLLKCRKKICGCLMKRSSVYSKHWADSSPLLGDHGWRQRIGEGQRWCFQRQWWGD